MSTTVPVHEAIRRTLACGPAIDATLRTISSVAAHLEPVIGAGGVDVLIRRSLKLASARFPWLQMPELDRSTEAFMARLEALLEGHEHDADAVLEAGYTLTVTFVELLASMIGEPLTERLLSPIWAAAPATKEQEAAK